VRLAGIIDSFDRAVGKLGTSLASSRNVVLLIVYVVVVVFLFAKALLFNVAQSPAITLLVLELILIVFCLVYIAWNETNIIGAALVSIPLVMLLVGWTTQSIIIANQINVPDTITVSTLVALLAGIIIPVFIFKSFGRSLLNSKWTILAIVFLMVAIFLLMAFFGISGSDGASVTVDLFGVLLITPAEAGKFFYLIVVVTILKYRSKEFSQFHKRMQNSKVTLLFFRNDRLRVWAILLLSSICFLLLIYSGELGSVLVMFFTLLVLLGVYIDWKDLRFCLPIFLLLSVALIFVFSVLFDFSDLFEKLTDRITSWLSFLQGDVYNEGNYQILAAQEAIYKGGIFGGDVRYYEAIPIATSDMVFSAVAQCFGKVGVIVVSVLYFTYATIGVSVAHVCKDDFYRGLTLGATSMLFLQASYQMAANLALVPITGNNIPFVSSGGISLLFSVALAGIIFMTHRLNERAGNAE
jgi:cell division protein FtsW (lipid II flippase)